MLVRRILLSIAGIVMSVAVLCSTTAPALGATSSSTGAGNGLRVAPVTTNIVVNPGQTQTVQISVQNVTKNPVELQAVVDDFTASTNESGEPALLLDPNQYAPSHSLKRYVAPINNFGLQAGEEKTITVSITIPSNAPGGGYFGAVRFAPASTASNNNVTLSASIGSLVLVRVPGNVKEQMTLESFDVRTTNNNSPQFIFTDNTHIAAVARFKNEGDVQEQPFGKVLLKQGNKQIAAYEINDITPRGNVLPASIRRFDINLDKVGLFGAYTLVANFGYGTNGQLLSAQTTFYVVPVGLLLAAAGVIILILLAIFVLPKLIRNYNERVVERAARK
jgi:hypothetical protein